MRIIVSTQVRENYGAHDWDGKGECPQRWKSKFGSDYCIADLTSDEVLQIINSGNPIEAVAEGLIDVYRDQIESDNDYFHEFILGWDTLEDGELTDMETSYIEYREYNTAVTSLWSAGDYCPIPTEVPRPIWEQFEDAA
jgi:hypothetical protein